MVYRYSWLAGSVALLFVLYQLNGLLKPTVSGPPWQLIIVAALVLGIAITWTALAYRLPTWLAVVLNSLAASIAIVRVSAPATALGFIPTGGTFAALGDQLDVAFKTIRQGVEPVIPIAGLVVILLVLFWTVGFLFAWGLTKGHPYVALLPPLVMALQFATMDRQGTSAIRAGIYVTIVAGCLLAVTLDQREHSAGRMVAVNEHRERPARLSRSSTGLLTGVIATAALAVVLLQGAVPADGVIDWRSPTGLTGDFYGSVSYNPFIGIKQRVVSFSNTPVFAATIQGEVPGDRVYFSLLTMETYNGGQFYASNPEVVSLAEDEWLRDGHTFVGDTDTIVADIEIRSLEMEWLPAAHAPVEFESTPAIKSSVLARADDAALRFEGALTFPGMRYQMLSEIPRPDPRAMAVDTSGGLSPSFAAAAAANEIVPPPVLLPERPEPPDVDRYLQVPDDLDPGIENLARRQTRNLTTPFEQAIALESWFRSDAFVYSTEFAPGHGASDLAAWLLDPSSPNWRRGYCENFATSMAMMARTLGIPSRVVLGFTPGTEQSDGVFVVFDRNAHAWVELWMPTQGWVRFDPTPRNDGVNPTTFEEIETSLGFPLTEYLAVPDPEPPLIDGVPVPPVNPFLLPDESAPISGGETAGGGLDLPAWITTALPWLAAIGLSFFGVPMLKWWRRRRRLRRLRDGDISAAWDEIVGRLDDLRAPPRYADTPVEVAARVDPAMEPLAVVYSRSVYGATPAVSEEFVDIAVKSFRRTEDRLASLHSRPARLRASYRLRTLVPKRWRRRR